MISIRRLVGCGQCMASIQTVVLISFIRWGGCRQQAGELGVVC